MPTSEPAAVALEEAQELEVGRRPALGRDVDRADRRSPGRARRPARAARASARARRPMPPRPSAAAAAPAAGDAHRRARARGARSLGDLRARGSRRRRGRATPTGVMPSTWLVVGDVASVASMPSASPPGTREQHAVERAALPQLLVRAGVEHRALVDDDDAVGERQRRPPVRDQDRRARAGDAPQRRVDLLLDARVDRRRRVVEQEDLRVGEQRARERDALPLTAARA